MTRISRLTAFCALITVIVAPRLYGESVLHRLPEDAIGFVFVRNLAETNVKIEGVLTIFQDVAPMPLPAPLSIVKAATGLGPGFDEQGEALLALLPGDDGVADPQPLLLVAVADYAAFAGAVQADATGEICRVTLAGEEVLAAKLSDFAVFMNVEDRQRLETLLASDASPHTGVLPLNEWLHAQDMAVVLTPQGVDMLSGLAKTELVNQAAAMQQHMAPAAFKELQHSMAFYGNAIEFLGAELDAAGLGLSIMGDSGVKLSTQAVLRSGGRLSVFAATLPSAGAAVEAFADKPYIVAAGGRITPQLATAAARLNIDLLKSNPKSHGFQNLTDDDWQTVEESWRNYTQGVQGLSMIAYLGEETDPLVSNVSGVLQVDDSSRYLTAYRASIEQWQKLIDKSTLDIDLEYRVSDIEVAGRKGLLTLVNMGEALEDQNVPTTIFIADALFGEDRQLRIYLACLDDHTVAFGVDDAEGSIEAVKSIADAGERLANVADVQTTLTLLPSEPGWVGLANPQGVVAWCERLYNKLLAQFGPATFELPDFPESPPVGIAVTMSKDRLSGELALPKQSLEALADYIEVLQQNAN